MEVSEMNQAKNSASVSSCAVPVVDLITRIYPYGMTASGVGALQWSDGVPSRWFCGQKTQLSFSLTMEASLVLALDFVNLLPGQGFTLTINGETHAVCDSLGVNAHTEKIFEFKGKMQNDIVIDYFTTSKKTGVFPSDSRDLALLYYGFVVKHSNQMCRDFTSAGADTSSCSWYSRIMGSILGESKKNLSSQKSVISMANGLPERFRLDSIAHLGDPEANASLCRSEYESGQTVLHSLPPVVTLALTTRCNNKTPCVICDRNTRDVANDVELDSSVLQRATPLLKTARYVLLHCGGESMFSRYFDDVISMITPPTRVTFATNAMLMTNKRADKMLEKDIMAGFVVSLDAATAETYKIMRPGSKFETVISNVAYYIEQAKKLGRTETNITLNMTLCAANIHEASLLVDLAAKIGAWGVDYNHLNAGLTHVAKTSAGWDWDYVAQAQFQDKEFHDRMLLEAYYNAKDKGIRFSLVGRPFIGPNADKYQEIVCDMTCQVAFQEGEGVEHWNSPHHKAIAPKVPACFKPWQETVIQPDGGVRACYFHDISEWGVGHLKHSDFMSVWNSDQMIRTREQFLEHAFARSCAESQPCLHRGRS
jgi:MoaA/NifB/PqqE/SkfB family radical SAM enzyme